ncbi:MULTISPECIES: Hsp20/alpha crystallin family protein [Sorangium]|uniref:Heat-shock protein Hsp20 n=1 Tax=Sorangium cellulosum TaxID=56 RepID=A0A4P2R463_SORCE|nr:MULTISPECIES: Hsp20/alpha crystallin family protein [Sorangium]AUX37518.1 heat-shock protein Hsp20 [Sorangium cellulosum]WCQ96807.1 Spore protein SP21 [Sorangium sp. Soce836]
MMRALDPERMMREMFQWDPFAEMEPVTRLRQPEAWFSPDIELRETKDRFVFRADLPGVKESDVDVSISGRQLSISGKRDEEREEREGERVYAYEREYGSFCRSFTLPESADLDNIQAELKNGVLEIIVPKAAGVKPKQIPLRGKEPSAEGSTEAKKSEAKKAA